MQAASKADKDDNNVGEVITSPSQPAQWVSALQTFLLISSHIS